MTDQLKSLINIRQHPPTGKPFTAYEPPFKWQPLTDGLQWVSANGWVSTLTSQGQLITNQPQKGLCGLANRGFGVTKLGDQRQIQVSPEDTQLAWAWANQFQGFGLGTDKFTYPGCSQPCEKGRFQESYPGGYFQYGGVKLPTHFVPQLEQIFNKYL